MDFEELLDNACTAVGLPSMAREQLPVVLSSQTKKMVLTLSPEEFGQILATAIENVNKGSIKSIDKLVREQLNR